jgi:hypothetical protein
MDWKTLILGLGGTAVAVTLAALVILNPAAGLKLASQVAGFLLDVVRRAVAWARDPARDWWKIGCLTFSALFAVASVVANHRHQAATELAREYDVLELEADGLEDQLAKANEKVRALEAQLAKEIGLKQEVARLNQEAVAKVQAKAAQAAAQAADWRRRYRDRPDTCKAAQAALEEQCASLSDF